MLNVFCGVGHPARVPEYLGVSKKAAKFSLALHTPAHQTGGEDEVTFLEVLVLGEKLAAFAVERLSTKTKVSIQGRLKQNNWTDRDGNKRSTVQCVVGSIDVVDWGQQARQGEGHSYGARARLV
jgi:single-strand DNA-binding protein